MSEFACVLLVLRVDFNFLESESGKRQKGKKGEKLKIHTDRRVVWEDGGCF